MGDNTYGGSVALLSDALSSIITPDALSALLGASASTDGSYSVVATNGASSVSITSPTSAVLVNAAPEVLAGLAATAQDSTGGYSDVGAYATTVTNTSGTPVTIAATGSAFVELQGAATVDGQDAATFIVDSSHNTADVNLKASSGNSFLIGGSAPGNDTLTGSTSSTGAAVLVAGSANTTVTGGAGADTLIGGGASTIAGGTGIGQVLYDFSANAHDSFTAGSGGYEKLSVSAGTNVLNDAMGSNDTLFAGSGMDTLFGSTNGSSIALYQGNSSVVSAASDTIFAAQGAHGDTITASTSATDEVTFAGYSAQQVQSLVIAAQQVATGSTDPAVYGADQSVSINFSAISGVNQTATLNNVSHIHFNNG